MSDPTHERNVLVWLAYRTHCVAVVLFIAALLLALAVFLGAVGCVSPTSSTDVGTPMEEAAVAFAQCHGKHQRLGRDVRVVFHDSERGDGALAWAWPGGSTVNLARPWVNATDLQQLELTVAHEMCHITGIWREDQANFCAQLAYRDAGCREET